MAKAKTLYTCTECGGQTLKWQGQCPHCSAWNTLVETVAERASARYQGLAQASQVQELTQVEAAEEPRRETGIPELDRVLGGGLVRGAVVLLGGDPGIGKSTLLLQALSLLCASSRTLYVSGEESAQQVALRARRLGLPPAGLKVLAEIQLEKVLNALGAEKPEVAVIDSIQTIYSEALQSAPGSVAQVRECAAQLTRFAKTSGTTLLLVGHVTKEGAIAGPRVLEHMVDAVLYFEGEGGHHYRILRTIKNRFGPTDEIGVFEMSDRGLREVANPSELFLGERAGGAPGAAVFAGMEGTRPVLVEIQALVAPSPLGTPRRSLVGWDSARLSMVLAVLEAHCGVRFSANDVYLNVAGGYKISEPAADLAVAAALVSSLTGLALPTDCVYFGEISLSGAIRPVAHAAQRLKEAEKLGFRQAVMPVSSGDVSGSLAANSFKPEHLADLVARIAGTKRRRDDD